MCKFRYPAHKRFEFNLEVWIGFKVKSVSVRPRVNYRVDRKCRFRPHASEDINFLLLNINKHSSPTPLYFFLGLFPNHSQNRCLETDDFEPIYDFDFGVYRRESERRQTKKA